MGHAEVLRVRRSVDYGCRGHGGKASPGGRLGRVDCLEQLLQAFYDIADRDDIHQAALRLALVQEWIRGEADGAAADPIFAGLSLAS
jgi:hypothetical protein